MKPPRLFLAGVLLAASASLALAQKKLTTAEAKDHIGEEATVCGKVVSTRYARVSRDKPTFLNLDKPYPNPVFTVVIWERDRNKFGKPEVKYKGKKICVTGKITQFHGALPQIEPRNPTQIQVETENPMRPPEEKKAPIKPPNSPR